MSTLPVLKEKCQDIFNLFIKMRDVMPGGLYFKCISCGEIKPRSSMHAGHYYNVGHYDSMRYLEDNCHGQCSHCNTFLRGNLILYGINLEKKIGKERFEKLHFLAALNRRNTNKWYRFEIMDMIALFKKKIKDLEKGFNNYYEQK